MKKRYLLGFAALSLMAGIIQIAIGQAHVKDEVASIVKHDEAGADVTIELKKLQTYVQSHILTSTSLTLSGSYNRARVVAEAAAISKADGDIYSKAQAACAKRSDSITLAKCVSNYVAANSTPGANPQAANMPSPSDFRKTFTSPPWTPDGAGLALLISASALILVIYLGLIRR